MKQMEQSNLFAMENQRLSQQNIALQQEVFELKDELKFLRLKLMQSNEMLEKRADVQVKSTQTGSLASSMPFKEFITSGTQASSTFRISVHDAIRRHDIKIPAKDDSKSTKAKNLRVRRQAATEILWELGYSNDSITKEDTRLVRKRISASLSNQKYDSKPEVIAKKKHKRKSTASGSLNLSAPHVNSSAPQVMENTSDSDISSDHVSESVAESSNNVDEPASVGLGDDSLDYECGEFHFQSSVGNLGSPCY